MNSEKSQNMNRGHKRKLWHFEDYAGILTRFHVDFLQRCFFLSVFYMGKWEGQLLRRVNNQCYKNMAV